MIGVAMIAVAAGALVYIVWFWKYTAATHLAARILATSAIVLVVGLPAWRAITKPRPVGTRGWRRPRVHGLVKTRVGLRHRPSQLHPNKGQAQAKTNGANWSLRLLRRLRHIQVPQPKPMELTIKCVWTSITSG